MLLIDGVKYEEWVPPSEDEFDQVVKEHAKDIFGEQSVYLDIKTRLKSELGTGSIPDGFVIFFGDIPRWRIVEVELSSHPLHDHIVAQVGRFISGIENPSTQKKIVDIVYGEVVKNDLDALKLRKAIQPIETYKFLSDLISKQPILTIIIEKDTEELREALNTLRYPQIKVVELKTFIREGVGLSVHVHLFEPLYKGIAAVRNKLVSAKDEDTDSPLIFIKVKNFWITYKRLSIPSEHLNYLSLSHDTSFELETDVGIIKTKIDKWNQICIGMGEWYKAHPELKAGDSVLFKVLEPMKKYSLHSPFTGRG